MTRGRIQRNPYSSFPAPKDFLDLVHPKAEQVVLNGHTALDGVLDVAISESVERPDALELDRLNFMQKVSIAIAFGVIPPDSRPAYQVLNNARNDVAHNLSGELDAQALLSSLSEGQRGRQDADDLRTAQLSGLGAAIFLIWSLYEELRTATENRREKRLRAEARADIEREALSTANLGVAWGEARQAEEEDIARRVAAKKETLGYTYVSPRHRPPWRIEGD